MPRSAANKSASIRRSIQVGASPRTVYDAFRTSEAMSTWYMDGTTVEFAVNGSVTFEGPEANVRATFVELVPDERIVLDYHAP